MPGATPPTIVDKRAEAVSALTFVFDTEPLADRIIVQPANQSAFLSTQPAPQAAQVYCDPSAAGPRPFGLKSVIVPLTSPGVAVIDVASTAAKSSLTLNPRVEVWEDLNYIAAIPYTGHAVSHNALLPFRRHAATTAMTVGQLTDEPLWDVFYEAVFPWPDGPTPPLSSFNWDGYGYASLAAARCADFARRKRRKLS